jgi:predicted RNA-binding protein YlxR (DUF448 family)
LFIVRPLTKCVITRWSYGSKALVCIVQRPQKHFESGGVLAKRGTFVYVQNQTILCRSRAERKFLKIQSLHNVGNGLYRVFTAAKRALSFRQKRAFIQEILFSFFKWGTLAQKNGTFFTFKKSGGGGAHAPRFRCHWSIVLLDDFTIMLSCYYLILCLFCF